MEVYVCVGIWLGVSALLYYGISENSAYSNWKNINIIAYLQIGRMLKLYRNINLFGTPVSYLTVYLVTACAGIVVLAVVTTLGFGAQKIPMRSAWKLRMRRISLYKWSSLGCMEGRKILLHQQTLLFLLAAATAAWFLYTPVASIYWDQDDIYYKQYMDQLSGPYTDAKEQQICKWEKEMETYEQEREAALENATTDLMASLITDKYDDLMKPENALQKVRSHADYIKSVPNSAFFYPRGYEQLTGGENAGNGDALHALAAVLLVILCMTGVYGMEYATGMRRLLYCSTEGRGKLHAWKWGISVLIVTVIYALVYVPWFYQIFSAFGSDGIQASVASMEHISKIYAGFSVGEYLCLISVGRYLGLLAVMACIFWLSRMTKSYMLTIAIATAFVVLPLLLELSGIGGMQYILLNPLLLGNI